jgi:hypothetical protein
MEPEIKMFSPYEVVTISSKRTGMAVAWMQDLVDVVADDVAVVVIVEYPHNPLPLTLEDGINTRGSPEAMGTAISPLESTVTEVQV